MYILIIYLLYIPLYIIIYILLYYLLCIYLLYIYIYYIYLLGIYIHLLSIGEECSKVLIYNKIYKGGYTRVSILHVYTMSIRRVY